MTSAIYARHRAIDGARQESVKKMYTDASIRRRRFDEDRSVKAIFPPRDKRGAHIRAERLQFLSALYASVTFRDALMMETVNVSWR